MIRVESVTDIAAQRLRCRFDNAPLLASQQRDGFEITEADIDFGD